MTTTRIAAAVLLALLAAACAADPGMDEAGCAEPAAPGSLIEDALALGLAGAGRFEPVAEGAAMELVLGSQGGWMITPILAVDRRMMASDGACVHVTVEVDLDGGDAPITFDVTVPELGGTDDHFYSEPLPVFLSYDVAALEGRRATITAVLEDDDVASSCQVAVELANRD
jgi:hypothetical protein